MSKGIPESIWTTTEPEVWENDLNYYIERKDFDYAKEHHDPRVFPIYLRIVDNMQDKDFNSLTDEQKKEFIFGKFDLTDKQFEFAKTASGYYNSLDLNKKIEFAKRTENEDLIAELAKNQELSPYNVFSLIYYTNDIDKIAKILGRDKINKLERGAVQILLHYAMLTSEIHKMAKILGQENIDKIYVNDIYQLFLTSKDKYEMAEILGSYNISKLDDHTVSELLKISDHNEVDSAYKLAMIIIKYKKELSSSNVFACLQVITNIDNKHKIIEALGSESSKR